METIHNVPAPAVGRVVQDFIDDGATNVIVQQNSDGTFDVTRQ